MNKLVKLSDLFHIEYGNQLDLNKLTMTKVKDGINFVSRQATNLGVQGKVKINKTVKPYTKGAITVTLGGSLLATFVQEADFYTGQNIKVLTPKIKLNNIEKHFYCYAIINNRYRYSSHGREANKTLDDILVPHPASIPKWIYDVKLPTKPNSKPYHNKLVNLSDKKWQFFYLKDLFLIERGKEIVSGLTTGNIALISASETNNGLNCKVKAGKKLFKAHSITVANNGSVGACFYQNKDFYATTDVTILSNENINIYNGMFISTLIKKEKYRFNYGRKWSNDKMKNSKVKFPVDNKGNPDWQFMEDYIKSLPYSSNLEYKKTT